MTSDRGVSGMARSTANTLGERVQFLFNDDVPPTDKVILAIGK
jgi:hypothetical protein